jgi:hypothetical protein
MKCFKKFPFVETFLFLEKSTVLINGNTTVQTQVRIPGKQYGYS